MLAAPALLVCRLQLPSKISGPEDLQEKRRQELTAYLQQLKQTHSDSTQNAELTFGADFYSLVQRLSQQRKTEFESTRGTTLTFFPCAPQHNSLASWCHII